MKAKLADYLPWSSRSRSERKESSSANAMEYSICGSTTRQPLWPTTQAYATFRYGLNRRLDLERLDHVDASIEAEAEVEKVVLHDAIPNHRGIQPQGCPTELREADLQRRTLVEDRFRVDARPLVFRRFGLEPDRGEQADARRRQVARNH